MLNERDPNLARKVISVMHNRATDGWTHSQAPHMQDSRPGQINQQSWRTVAEATHAAIAVFTAHPEAGLRGITGHPDRELLRQAGIEFIDSRGNRRRGKASRVRDREKSRAKWQAKLDAKMAADGGAPMVAAMAKAQDGSPDGSQPYDRLLPQEREGGKLSAAKLAALEAARAKREIARERQPPEGYRSVEHFLDSAREAVARRPGGTMELSRYLRVNESSVRKWLKREKLPLQATIEAINRWMISAGYK